jgi:hypothetical protein
MGIARCYKMTFDVFKHQLHADGDGAAAPSGRGGKA